MTGVFASLENPDSIPRDRSIESNELITIKIFDLNSRGVVVTTVTVIAINNLHFHS